MTRILWQHYQAYRRPLSGLQGRINDGHLRISQDICHVRMTDIEGFLTIYGHSDNLLNNKLVYQVYTKLVDKVFRAL